MKYLSRLFISGFLFFSSCEKDEDLPFDHKKQFNIDHAKIREYLKTHYFHPKKGELWKIGEKKDGSLPKKQQISLLEDTRLKTIENIKANDLNYKMYYFVVEQGKDTRKNPFPSTIDSVYTTYKGFLLNDDIFDESEYPIWLNLSETVKGFSFGFQKLKAGILKKLPDEDFTFTGTGKGFLFFPSGMGYLNSDSGAIPANSPLIFKINLYNFKRTDSDLDGVFNYKELKMDASGNFEFLDTDGDGTENHRDTDDDGDGILTKDEIKIVKNSNGEILEIMYLDTNKNGIFDYLEYNPKK